MFFERFFLSMLAQHMMSASSSFSQSSSAAASDSASGGDNHLSIVSLQSSVRPGCVLELDLVVDSEADWSDALLLHVSFLFFRAVHRNRANILFISMDYHIYRFTDIPTTAHQRKTVRH